MKNKQSSNKRTKKKEKKKKKKKGKVEDCNYRMQPTEESLLISSLSLSREGTKLNKYYKKF